MEAINHDTELLVDNESLNKEELDSFIKKLGISESSEPIEIYELVKKEVNVFSFDDLMESLIPTLFIELYGSEKDFDDLGLMVYLDENEIKILISETSDYGEGLFSGLKTDDKLELVAQMMTRMLMDKFNISNPTSSEVDVEIDSDANFAESTDTVEPGQYDLTVYKDLGHANHNILYKQEQQWKEAYKESADKMDQHLVNQFELMNKQELNNFLLQKISSLGIPSFNIKESKDAKIDYPTEILVPMESGVYILSFPQIKLQRFEKGKKSKLNSDEYTDVIKNIFVDFFIKTPAEDRSLLTEVFENIDESFGKKIEKKLLSLFPSAVVRYTIVALLPSILVDYNHNPQKYTISNVQQQISYATNSVRSDISSLGMEKKLADGFRNLKKAKNKK